jgi:hypothetical protein
MTPSQKEFAEWVNRFNEGYREARAVQDIKADIPHHTNKTAAERKAIPLASGCLDYFPLALMEVAKCSLAGNEQHNKGKPLHWDRSKSGDHADALLRHLVDRGTFDTDGIRHAAKIAWRALALLQEELEGVRDAKTQVQKTRSESVKSDPLPNEGYCQA